LTIAMACTSDTQESTDEVECLPNGMLVQDIEVLVIPVLNGQPSMLPPNIGLTDTCTNPLHTRDDSSLVHFEGANGREYYLGDLFDLWGAENPYTGIPLESISVNGKRFNGGLGELKLEEGLRIVVAFREEM